MKQNFIKTNDVALAAKLRKSGYTAVGQENQTFVFLNNGKLTFSESDKNKIVYTNIINM